ncbi:hypothetical protein BDF21DRAFT_442423 [Thamnidium elegans]|nr:hypothetical protein BDF21DRAFT_442423 [Thamnidium elegans]
MYPDPQQALDDVEIAKEIAAITLKKEFPFFFKVFTIPTISKLLVATGEFANACPRRIKDTQLILYEMLDTSNPNIPQQDTDDQCKREKEVTDSLYRVWYDVSITVNIENFPRSPEKLFEFTVYSPSNWKCGENTARLLFTRFLPSFLHEKGYQMSLRLLPFVLSPDDVIAFGLLYKKSKLITWALEGLLGLRAIMIRCFMLPRLEFVCRTPFYANTEGKYVPGFFLFKPYIYKDGYNISELGLEIFLEKKNEQCPFASK